MSAAPALPHGCTLAAHARLGSTNDEAKRLAGDGAAEWTVVWAREQTAGRGRGERLWYSPAGNLYMSVILRPEVPAAQAAQLGFAAAVSVAIAIESVAPAIDTRVTLKWPNDVLLGGEKVSGILLESASGGGGALDWLVVGIGVNVASHPELGEGGAATSLHAAGAPVTIETMLEQVTGVLCGWTTRWEAEGFAPVRAAWLARATGLGGPITVTTRSETLVGTFCDLDAHGALVLDSAEGRRVITSGEVFAAAA